MLVRIRWARSEAGLVYRQRVALATGSLLAPLALAAFTVGLWGFASELQWAGQFAISKGLLSHWQLWLAGAAVLLLFSRFLSSYGNPKQDVTG